MNKCCKCDKPAKLIVGIKWYCSDCVPSLWYRGDKNFDK